MLRVLALFLALLGLSEAFAPLARRPWAVGQGSRLQQWGLRADVQEEKAVEDEFTRLASRLYGTSIYFVGMMGTGKSTTGRELAKKLPGYSFLDTDTVIEAYAGQDCSAIFEKEGEEGFRNIESMVMDQACAYRRLCIATGGGAVLRNQNWGKMQTGIVVWLQMEPEEIAERFSGNDEEVEKRPLLQGGDAVDKLREILDKRKEKYEVADVHVQLSPGDSVEEVVERVCGKIHRFMDENPPKFADQNAEFIKG
uniref:Shikimate kinase n=1 Tax=Pinguiococcus pyrenoidosus TaxID=172671 RepID=A0A7R9UH62_9STRA|mmetsp:Transcript_9015/g.34021  ORF Transcript_9015/g.34021 Transcript_9015/m.34021 type:complete len:253 (+) Transcript_9015:106-864(+)